MRSMVEMKKIRDLTSLIAREFNPDRIILFGSYASGQPDYDSDVDILVVLPFKGKAVRKAIEIRNRINAQIPLDLRSEEYTSELQSQSNLVCRLLLEKKKKLNRAS